MFEVTLSSLFFLQDMLNVLDLSRNSICHYWYAFLEGQNSVFSCI